jgi:hypothetical protein
MTEIGDQYERFLADFGEQLHQAQKRRAGRTHSRRRVTTGALALGILAAGIVLLTGTGGGRGDVVSEAQAALAPAGQLLHLVSTSRLEMRGGSQSEVTGREAESVGWNRPRVAEEWSAASPARWRIATTIPTGTARGFVTAAPIQCAYANGSEETYDQAFQTNELDITPVSKGHDESSQESPCTDQVSGGLGTEPVAHIHAMLEAGELNAAGKGTVNGHAVLRLTGKETRSDLNGAGRPWPVEYDVDPETYAPVRFTVEMVGANALGNTGTLTEVTDVTAYERLPFNQSTAALLSVKTIGSPTIRHGINQFEARLHDAAANGEGENSAARSSRHAADGRRLARDRHTPGE